MTGGPALSAAEGERVWYRFGEEREMGRGPSSAAGWNRSRGLFFFFLFFLFLFFCFYLKPFGKLSKLIQIETKNL
jgi:hypothetical protein